MRTTGSNYHRMCKHMKRYMSCLIITLTQEKLQNREKAMMKINSIILTSSNQFNKILIILLGHISSQTWQSQKITSDNSRHFWTAHVHSVGISTSLSAFYFGSIYSWGTDNRTEILNLVRFLTELKFFIEITEIDFSE